MDATHITILIASVLGLLYVQRSALARGRRQGLEEAVRIALRHMNRTSKLSRTGHEIVKQIQYAIDPVIEDEHGGYTKEQS